MGAVFCLIIAIGLGYGLFTLRGKEGKYLPYFKAFLVLALVITIAVAIVGGLPMLGSVSGPG